MRVTTEFWVKAFVRKVHANLASAMIVRHGDDQAGAIHIKVARLDGTAALYSPAPTSFAAGDGLSDGERSFTAYLPAGTAEAEVDRVMVRQHDFDSDLWLVEVEDRQGRHFLDGWLA